MNPSHRLGQLQLAIMRELWRRGEATVAEVHEALLPERGLAPTTIATMLTKLERKGVVTHRTERRRYVYRPLIGEQDVHRSMVDDLVRHLFGGDASALVHHLLREGEIGDDDLDDLRARIEQQEEDRDGR